MFGNNYNSSNSQFYLPNTNQNTQYVNNSNIQQSPYLQSEKLNTVTETQFNNYLLNFDSNDLLNLRTAIFNSNYNTDPNYKPNIGFFNTLSQLIERAYNFNQSLKTYMMGKYALLNDDIYRYRPIKGDGNCFYRAVIFSFIEQLILFNELQCLKNLIFDIQSSFNEYPLRNSNIQVLLIIKVLILIHVALKKNKKEQAYELYIKSLVNNNQFDNGLILYLRYKIFKYIKANEQKLYTSDFSIKLGNLLPIEYETNNGDFLFSKFYDEYLLQMGKDAEKIVIYIVPFVLCVKIEIVMFDCENDFRKTINYIGPNNFQHKVNIALLNKKEHYELIYTKEYYNMNIELFQKYTVTNYKNIVLTDIIEDSPNNVYKPNLIQFEDHSQKAKVVNLVDFTNQSSTSNTVNPIQNNVIKCSNCKTYPIMVRSGFQLCQMCYINIIKTQLCKIYLKNISSLRQIFKTNTDSSSFNRIFFQMFQNEKLKINNAFFPIENSIQLVNRYLNPNTKLTMINFFNEYKQQYCLQCQQPLSAKLPLPCGCCFCSNKCLETHFSTVNNLDIKKTSKDFECICTTIYEPYQIFALIILFARLDLKQLKESAMKLYKKITKDKCAKCQVNIKESKLTPVFLKCTNEIIDPSLGFLGKNICLLHSLCWNCFNNGNLKNYFCVFCRGGHNVISRENNNDGNCILSE